MSYRKIVVAALLCLLVLANGVMAQSPQSTPASATANPAALAFVNGQPITLSDLHPQVREMAESLDANVAEARRNALETQIRTILFEAEAGRRKITVEKLLDVEIFDRVIGPTNAEIQAVYDEKRAEMGAATLETMRPQIVTYIRSQRAQKLISEMTARLRTTNKVVMGPDVNTPNLAPSTVLATVNGQAITAVAFEEKVRQEIYDLRMKVYETEKDAVERKINDLLLAAEAKRRNVTEQDVIRTDITAQVIPVTDADIAKFYEENKALMQGGDLETRRDAIRRHLEQQEQERLEKALVARIRTGAEVRVLLNEPEPIVEAISVDDDPSHGNPKAILTVIMFTDFQCPTCASMHPVVEEALKPLGERVRLVVRDFPLSTHAHAHKAAEAAGAANAQGKFFEYISLLYKNQSALDVPSLKKYASTLGLDRARFDRELDGGVYAAEVSHDVADGKQYGIRATPTIFINGVRLREMTPEAFKKALERMLAQASRTSGNAAK